MAKRAPDGVDPFHKKVGDRVKFARLMRGMAQKELGALLGFSPPASINRVEAGVRGFTTKDIALIATTLDVSPTWILFGHEWMQKPGKRRKHIMIAPKLHPAVQALIDSGLCGQLSVPELHRLQEHVEAGNSAELFDLDYMIKLWRYQHDPSDKNAHELQVAQDKKRGALGVRKRKSTLGPVSNTHRRRRNDESDVG